MAKLAADYVAWGVDAIAVATDLEETPAGLSDLFAVCRAVKVPVLQWDWFLHPLQVKHCFSCLVAALVLASTCQSTLAKPRLSKRPLSRDICYMSMWCTLYDQLHSSLPCHTESNAGSVPCVNAFWDLSIAS